MNRVLKALEGNPSAASLLRRQASVRQDIELAELLTFHTDAIRDLQDRCNGNPFDSKASGNMTDPERGDREIISDPLAVECARSLQAPAGQLQLSLIALDAEYDPVIPDWVAEEYASLLRKTGKESLFVHEVVPGYGHLSVSVAHRRRAFSALVRWSVDGVRPSNR